MRKHILLAAGAAILIALPSSLIYFLPAWAADCKEPPFITTGIQSNVLFILDNSGSMCELAYEELQGSMSSTSQVNTCNITSLGDCATNEPNCPTWNNTSRTTCQSSSHECSDTFPWTCNQVAGDTGAWLSGTCTVTYRCRWNYTYRTCRRYVYNTNCVCTDGPCVSWGYTRTSGDADSPSTVNITVTEPSSGLSGNAYYGYNETKKYYGYFDPDKTYKYSNTSHYFYPDGGTVVDPGGNGYRAACAAGSACDKFSGNWLNWLCMRRIDVAKRVLTGGRLGGDPDEYVLVGTPTDRARYKMFNDTGTANGVHYTPFRQGFVVYFYNNKDLEQRTGTNGAFVPLMAFFQATFSTPSHAVVAGTLETASLGNDSSYGNPGESKLVDRRSYGGSYYFAVKHSAVADNTPPLGIIQNMSSKVRIGLMHFNYGQGPAEGYSLGGLVNSWDINGDYTTDYTERRADGGRVINRIGDPTMVNSWQIKGGSPVQIYSTVQNVNEILATTWTPLAETLREAMNYFRQQTPCYSWRDKDNMPQVDFQINNDWDPYYYAGSGQKEPCAQSYIILVTDGAATQDHPCYCSGSSNCTPINREFRFDGTFQGSAGYLDDLAYQMFTEDNRPDISGEPAKKTISLYTVFAFETDPDAREYLQRSALAGGFDDLNKDDEPGKPLGGCAENWQTCYDCSGYDGYFEWDADNNRSPDHFFEAQDGYQLETQLQSIFSQVALGGAAGAVATISQQTKEGDAIIRGAFDAVDPLDRSRYIWNGRLEVYWPDDDAKYEFDYETNLGLFCSQITDKHTDDKGNSPCCWDAAEKMKSLTPAERANRKIFTHLASRAAADRQTDFTMANWEYLQPLMRQTHGTPVRDGVPEETDVKGIIQWTRGIVNAAGYPLDDGGAEIGTTAYRDRKGYLIGDIVYSTPVIVGPPPLASVSSADKDLIRGADNYHDGAETFWNFRNYWLENPVEGDYKGRPKIAYVGANDGMLHAFLVARLKKDGSDWVWDYNCPASGSYPACGSELWAYIPSNLLGELVALAATDYGSQAGCKHRTLVDLSPKAWDVFIKSDSCGSTGRPTTCGDEKCWRTIIIGGERGGGDTYFAVDVTDPLNPKVLWEHSVLKNLAVAYEESGQTKITLPFRENDLLHDADTGNDSTCPTEPTWLDTWPDTCFDSLYFNLKTLPMSWTKAVLGRVRIPSDVHFWRYVSGGPMPTLEKTAAFTDCDNKRHVAFIGTGFQIFDFADLPATLTNDAFKKALTKPHLLALDLETGENYFQVLWPLAIKARTDAGLMPDQHMPASNSSRYIPWAFGSPSLVDVWSNSDADQTSSEAPDNLTGTFAEDGFVDRLYMGDVRGFFYRMVFNLKDYGTSNGSFNKGMHVELWPTKPIPAASTPNNPLTCDETNNYRGCRQPIQSAPAISYELGSTATDNPKLRVLFGTGKFDKVVGAADDKTDMTKMSFYNLVDEIKSFNCSIVDGKLVCQDALPEISPRATYSIDETQTPALVTLSGADPQKGFLLGDTNFGFSFGDGACRDDSDGTAPYNYWRSCTEGTPTSCTGDTLKRVCGEPGDPGYSDCASTCKQVPRTSCCDWIKATGGDCCQGVSCDAPACDASAPTRCTPCWDCIFDFATPGERVIGDPVIAYGLVFFTTYIPETTACSAGGRGWLYVLDYRCKSLGTEFNPVTDPVGRTVLNLPDFGAKVDLGAGMPSEPVMDSTGQYIFVQKSDATVVKIGAGGGGGDGGGGGSGFRDIQLKGWDKR